MNDDELSKLFAETPRLDDQAQFEARLLKRLQGQSMRRHLILGMAGTLGGLYALGQFMRSPEGMGAPAKNGLGFIANPVRDIEIYADEGIRSNLQNFEFIMTKIIEAVVSAINYMNIIQSQNFFWVCFSLCLASVAYFYAENKESWL